MGGTSADWGSAVVTLLSQEMPERLARGAACHQRRASRSAHVRADPCRACRARRQCHARANSSGTGHEGYRKAEVTGGGVALDEVDPRTLESRHVPGLYFCGEVLDAFGPIGGHNFVWAWATGRSAGLAAALACNP